MLMGIDGSLIGTLQRQLLTSEVSRCDFWGTKARTETSRFKTLPEPLRCRYCYQNTLLPAAWLSVPRDRGLSVSELCDSDDSAVLGRGGKVRMTPNREVAETRVGPL